MNDVLIRPWRDEDRPRLLDLWQQAFGDDRAHIEKFFSLFLTPEACLVAVADGQVVSAMYILDGPMIFPPAGRSLSTAYTYALATDPDWRGRGIGTAVYKACVKAALERADAVCVLPAEPSLYEFYTKSAGCRPISSVREAVIDAGEIEPGRAEDAAVISTGEYYLRRKALLRGQPYTVMTPGFYTLELYQMQQLGGGLISVDGDIAAVEMDGDTCRILELLAPEGDWMDVLQAVAARFPAARYMVRTPLFLPGPGQERPFVLAALRPDVDCPVPESLWWGFALD